MCRPEDCQGVRRGNECFAERGGSILSVFGGELYVSEATEQVTSFLAS